MTEGRSLSGKQAIRVDWIRFRVTAAMLRSCRMGWEIGGGSEARVAAGRSCVRTEHGKARTSGQGTEGDERRKLWEGRGRVGGLL